MADDKKPITPGEGRDVMQEAIQRVAAGEKAREDQATNMPTGERRKVLEKAMRSVAFDSYVAEHLTMQRELMEQVREIAPTIEAARESAAELGATVRQIQENNAALFESAAWGEIRDIMRGILEAAPRWMEYATDVVSIYEYLEIELQKPEYNGATIDDLLDDAETDENGDILPDTLFMRALDAARKAKEEAETGQEAMHATALRADLFEYPTDKPNTNLWPLLLKADANGQLSINFEMANDKDKRKGKRVPLVYSINFDALDDVQIVKRLTIYDKRVYGAVSALFNAGNTVITPSQIYAAMGNTSECNSYDTKKIYTSIKKMARAWIYLNNEREAEVYKRYLVFDYEGYLLPCEFHPAYINGKYVDTAICIYREPPLITFAKQRKQIATIDVKLLQSPISKTEGNMLIEDYLIVRISRAQKADDKKKRPERARQCRILYNTLFEHCGIPTKPKTNTEKSKAKRAKGKIKEYLDYYCSCGEKVGPHKIRKYTTENDGITVYW